MTSLSSKKMTADHPKRWLRMFSISKTRSLVNKNYPEFLTCLMNVIAKFHLRGQTYFPPKFPLFSRTFESNQSYSPSLLDHHSHPQHSLMQCLQQNSAWKGHSYKCNLLCFQGFFPPLFDISLKLPFRNSSLTALNIFLHSIGYCGHSCDIITNKFQEVSNCSGFDFHNTMWKSNKEVERP